MTTRDRLIRAQGIAAALAETNPAYLPIVYRIEAEIVEIDRALRAARGKVRGARVKARAA